MFSIQMLVSEQQKQKLNALAKKNNITVSALIRYVLAKSNLTSQIFKEKELIN